MAGQNAATKYGATAADGSRLDNAALARARAAHERVTAAGGSEYAAWMAGRQAAMPARVAHARANGLVAASALPPELRERATAGKATMVERPAAKPATSGPSTRVEKHVAPPKSTDKATMAGGRAASRDAPTMAGKPAASSRDMPTMADNAQARPHVAAEKPAATPSTTGFARYVGAVSPETRALASGNPTLVANGYLQQNWAMLPESYKAMVREHPVVKAGLIEPSFAYANILSGMRRTNDADTWHREFVRNLGSGKDGGAAPAKSATSVARREAATAVAQRAAVPTGVATIGKPPTVVVPAQPTVVPQSPPAGRNVAMGAGAAARFAKVRAEAEAAAKAAAEPAYVAQTPKTPMQLAYEKKARRERERAGREAARELRESNREDLRRLKEEGRQRIADAREARRIAREEARDEERKKREEAREARRAARKVGRGGGGGKGANEPFPTLPSGNSALAEAARRAVQAVGGAIQTSVRTATTVATAGGSARRGH